MLTWYHAMDFAIGQKGEPMDDLISRQAAIDEIEYELEMINSALDFITLNFSAREGLRQRRGEAKEILNFIQQLPAAQPEITDDQAIKHLQESGWMQNHDKQIYEMGLREQLADDSDSYDSLLPSAQPEQRWIPVTERLPDEELFTGAGKQFSDHVIMTVYNKTDDETFIDYGYTIDGEWISDTTECHIPNWWKVIAWMPLPEPYEVQK